MKKVTGALVAMLSVGSLIATPEVENKSTYDNCEVFEEYTETETYDGLVKERSYHLICKSEDEKQQMGFWVFDDQPDDVYFGLSMKNFVHDGHPSKTMVRVRCKVDDKQMYKKTFIYRNEIAFWKESKKEGNKKLDAVSQGKKLTFEFEQREHKVFKTIDLKGVDKAVEDFKKRMKGIKSQ